VTLDDFTGWLALPWHPIFVHFPVALLSLVWLLTVWVHLTGRDHWRGTIATFEAFGVAFLPLVVLTGLRDAHGIDNILALGFDQPLLWHAVLSLAAALLFTAHWLWRRQAARRGAIRPRTDLVLTTAGFWALLATGLLAGEMIFGQVP